MSSPSATGPRARQRERTREELLDAATRLMVETGVAELSLAEVARRVGLSQPSVYTYFDSRAEVFDALFLRGMDEHRKVVAKAVREAAGGWPSAAAAMDATLRFVVDHPVVAQLLFQRPVPGFTPSDEAYAPALDAVELVRTALEQGVERGQLHPDAATENGLGLLIVLTAGVSAQVLANEPGVPMDESRWARLLRPALELFARQLAPDGAGLPG